VSLTKPYKLSWAEDTKEKKEKMARIINLVFIFKKIKQEQGANSWQLQIY
jgi:hypothetical protein